MNGKKIASVAYFVGILIIFLTHIPMAIYMPAMRAHAIVNLVAGACIAFYYMTTEGYIRV